MVIEHLQQLLPVYATYLIATASPGPSNMAIMGVAMSQGRSSALALALGVTTGSMFWAVLAATGISALLASYADALFIIKIAGGLYLLYLAWKAAVGAHGRASIVRSGRRGVQQVATLSPGRPAAPHQSEGRAGLDRHHVPGAASRLARVLVPGHHRGLRDARHSCLWRLRIGVFTPLMVRTYQKSKRWIEGILSVAFAYAGIRLLLSKT